jgi:hypothetical protein
MSRSTQSMSAIRCAVALAGERILDGSTSPLSRFLRKSRQETRSSGRRTTGPLTLVLAHVDIAMGTSSDCRDDTGEQRKGVGWHRRGLRMRASRLASCRFPD